MDAVARQDEIRGIVASFQSVPSDELSHNGIHGTLLILLFSDPLVDVLSTLGKRIGIPAFYIAFVLAPLIAFNEAGAEGSLQSKCELIVVMVITPFVMNTFQLIVQDNFLKALAKLKTML